MAVNPMLLLKARERMEIFQREHPKIFPFFNMIKDNAVMEGTVCELKVTTPDGREYITNMRITENDLETVRILAGSANQGN